MTGKMPWIIIPTRDSWSEPLDPLMLPGRNVFAALRPIWPNWLMNAGAKPAVEPRFWDSAPASSLIVLETAWIWASPEVVVTLPSTWASTSFWTKLVASTRLAPLEPRLSAEAAMLLSISESASTLGEPPVTAARGPRNEVVVEVVLPPAKTRLMGLLTPDASATAPTWLVVAALRVKSPRALTRVVPSSDACAVAVESAYTPPMLVR